MAIDIAEQVARAAGAAAVAFAWIEAGRGIAASGRQEPGRASGLAARIGIVPAYLLVALPYFAICAVLWKPLPLTPPAAGRIAALALGSAFGSIVVGLYLWGRRSLGPMYNVTGTLGAQVYRGHRLVATGPYRLVRHPMYAGIALGAIGGLLLYRVWTFVFVLAAVPGMVLRARAEERLLRTELGDEYLKYQTAVPEWIPRVRGGFDRDHRL